MKILVGIILLSGVIKHFYIRYKEEAEFEDFIEQRKHENASLIVIETSNHVL